MELIEVTGYNDDHDAYMSDVIDSYGIMTAVNVLVKIDNIEGRYIEVGCHGLSALNRTFGCGVDEMSCKQAHFDLLSELNWIKNVMDTKGSCRHIPYH